MLKEYFTFEDIKMMPIRYLMDYIAYYKPKFKAIAQRQAQERIKAELENKKKKDEQRRMMEKQNKQRRQQANNRSRR